MATVVAFFFFKESSSGILDFVPLFFKNPIEEKIQKMRLKEKVGQVMFVSEQEGNYENNFGGLIINQQLNKTATASAILPFIAVDQEGGTVCRLPQLDCTGQREIGSVSQARDLAFKRAQELKSLGLNVILAPVLDIAGDESDFIWPRTFTGEVADLGAVMIEEFNRGGIIACPKHFPGHGGTRIDSHYQLPVIECDEQCLRERIEPFKKAIETGVKMMMMGHIQLNLKSQNSKFKTTTQNSNLDKPASLSKEIITDILRKELKFNGVIVTDDLNMGAIKAYQPDIGKAAVQAILAGADMVMVTGDSPLREKVYQRLLKAVESGEISQERLNESLRRILKLKQKYLFIQ